MKYELTLANVKKVINCSAVPEYGGDGLEFAIGDVQVVINKPYIDDDGEEMGNSIFIQHGETVLYISIVTEDGIAYFFQFYKEHKDDKLKPVKSDSPQHIIDFSREIWTKLVDDIETRTNAASDEQDGISYEAFSAQFGKHTVPVELEKLFHLQEQYGTESLSECFYLYLFNKTGLSTWSEAPSFQEAFIEFAIANGSGSTYAIWITGSDLSVCPVVVFGDEGGIFVVAENVRQFLRLLTYDTEISVNGGKPYFYKAPESEQESDNKLEYARWLKVNFNLDAIQTNEDANAIIDNAQQKFEPQLQAFLHKYNVGL